MFISDFAIKRPLVTVVAMVALALFGLVALLKLKTDEFPDVQPPFVTVGVPYPGASPDGVEKEILDPIEEQITAIAGVKQVSSKAYDGFGNILVEFQFGKNLTEATQEIRDAISGIRSDLPGEMKEPVVKKFSDTDVPIVSLALASNTLSQAQLSDFADPGITRELRSIAGVAEVQVFGRVEREISVLLRPDALQANGVSVAEVVQALQLQNVAAPVGRVEGALDERSIRLKGRFVDPREFSNLVVAERGGALVRLGQVADVRDGTEEPRSLAVFDGREAVGLEIKKAKGYSTTDVSDRVKARAAEIQKRLPAGTRLEVVRDAGTRVRDAVRNVEEALIEGAVLTVLVVFLFLNSWRSTVITGLALPVSVLASFIAVWAMGFQLETMSLLGLSLAIGILIDDAIVVRENIVRHVEMGKDHMTAAREGTDEIGLAVAATTFSILAVFVPIGFMPGIGGQWFKPFALTIACSVLVSLFVSFSLDPMLSAYWPDPHVPEEQKGRITKALDRFNAWFNRQAERYKGVIAWALDHRAAMLVMAVGVFLASFTLPKFGLTGLGIAIAGLGVMVFALTRKRAPRAARAGMVLAGFLVFAVPFAAPAGSIPAWRAVGSGFFPVDDQSEFIIKVETPPGSNLQYTRLKADEVARLVRAARGALHLRHAGRRHRRGGGRGQHLRAPHAQGRPRGERRGPRRARAGPDGADGGRHLLGVHEHLQRRPQAAPLPAPRPRRPDHHARRRAGHGGGAVHAGRRRRGAVDEGAEARAERRARPRARRGARVTAGQVAQALRPAFAGIDAGDWQDPGGQMRDVEVRSRPRPACARATSGSSR
jgi:HAE1 family hydrophobic/amphiphilic exporter-1